MAKFDVECTFTVTVEAESADKACDLVECEIDWMDGQYSQILNIFATEVD